VRTSRGAAWGAGVLVLVVAAACAQTPGATASRAQVLLSSGSLAQCLTGDLASGEIVREIRDPHTGADWLLMRNDRYPGGPGRLVLAGSHRNDAEGATKRAVNSSANRPEGARFEPVIRAGDRLIVEEHTAVADAVLEARALKPAALGSVFDVRLMIGGRIVRAVALGPGRAVFQNRSEARP
jgi:hypothetical protein